MKALLDGYSRIVPCDAAGVKTEQEMKIITFMGKKMHVAVLPSTLEKLTRETFNRGLQYQTASEIKLGSQTEQTTKRINRPTLGTLKYL